MLGGVFLLERRVEVTVTVTVTVTRGRVKVGARKLPAMMTTATAAKRRKK